MQNDSRAISKCHVTIWVLRNDNNSSAHDNAKHFYRNASMLGALPLPELLCCMKSTHDTLNKGFYNPVLDFRTSNAADKELKEQKDNKYIEILKASKRVNRHLIFNIHKTLSSGDGVYPAIHDRAFSLCPNGPRTHRTQYLNLTRPRV